MSRRVFANFGNIVTDVLAPVLAMRHAFSVTWPLGPLRSASKNLDSFSRRKECEPNL